MSLKKTKEIIREVAEGLDLVNTYYDSRWEDSIDKVPLYIESSSIEADRVSYQIEFKCMDLVNDQDKQFDAVQSDTLVVLKLFLSQLNDLNILDYFTITYESIESNQLVGWTTGKIKVYDYASNC